MDASLQSFWFVLHDSLLSAYDGNCTGKIQKIVDLINSSCKAKRGWYCPATTREVSQEACALQEQQFTAFYTWLLGRLFCIYEREEWSGTHLSCSKAQIEILIACSENHYMSRFLFHEYLCCLKDLMEIQSSKSILSEGPQLLKRFTPLPVDSYKEMNLMPKYVLVSSGPLVKYLIKHIIEILDSVVQFVVHVHEDLIVDLELILCQLLSVATVTVKLKIVSIFSQIVAVMGCDECQVMQNLCCALKQMMQALPYLHSGGKSSSQTQELCFAVGNLLNTIITCGATSEDEMRNQDLLFVLRSLLLAWELESISGPALRTACCNVVSVLHKMPHGSIDIHSYTFLLRTAITQEPAIRIFEHVMLTELVDHFQLLHESSWNRNVNKATVQSMPNFPNDKWDITALALPTWDLLHNKLWDDMAVVQSCLENLSKRSPEQWRNLFGRVNVIVCSAVGLDALALTYKDQRFFSLKFFGMRAKEFINILKLVFLSISSSNEPLESRKVILTLAFTTVANLMLLPEMMSCSVEDAKFVVSLLSLPWIHKNDLLDLQIDQKIVILRNMFQGLQVETDGESLNFLSLKVLANVPYGLCPLWRLSLFELVVKQLVRSESEQNLSLALKAMEIIPCLLMDSSQQASEVLGRILLPVLRSGNDQLLTALSKVFSSVVCVLEGNYVPVSVKVSSGYLMRSLVCRTCHKKLNGSQFSAVNGLHSFKTELLDFMVLLQSPIIAVRHNMVLSLSSLVLHLPSMYQPDILSKWMKFAVDDNELVRTVYSRMVKFLIFQRGWMEDKEIESENLKEEHIPLTQVDRAELSHSRPRLERVLHILFHYINKDLSSKNQDFALQNTLLQSIIDIGCIPLDCVLLPVIKIVLMCVSHPKFAHPSVAQAYLKQIADAHNTSVTKLYRRFQSDICQVLVTLAGMNFHARSLWTNYMDKVVYAVGFKSTSLWLRESFTRIAPILFVYVVKLNDEKFLSEIISLLETNYESLIRQYFEYIYPYVFLNEDDGIVSKCIHLMESLSHLPSKELFIDSFKNIHNELLLHYKSKRERVEAGICELISVLEKKQAIEPRKLQVSTTPQDIAEHLNKRFLGVLIHFDFLLESADSEEGLKIKALESLPEIICLLGPKYITPVRFKVFSTLRTALRLTHCDFPHLSCRAWEAFIKSVELQALGPLLSTIVVSLLPLLTQYEDEISSMLRWLVIEHEQELSDYIPDLFFLPRSPVIRDVNSIVQKHLRKVENVSKGMQHLADYLLRPLGFVSHDNVDIRKHGLQHLLQLLATHQERFTNELLSQEIVHPDVAKLLNLLVKGCHDTDQDVRLLCVQNLGMLGALDPSHLPHKLPKKEIPHICFVKEDQFGVQALTVLAKGYHAARNTSNLDRFSLAIQDLMKHYKISSSLSSGKKLWDLFPDNVQQIMAPLESTSYYSVWQQNTVWPHPIFGTRFASTLTSWAHTWACRLVNFIDEQFVKAVFAVCIPCLKADVNCVIFFLPYILLNAVIYGNEDQQKMMADEILIIIQHRKQKEEGEESHLPIFNDNLHIRCDRSVTLSSPDNSDSATHALCAKTVFSLLDFMEKWVNRTRIKLKDTSQKDETSRHIQTKRIERVKSFLDLFSKLDLAYGNYSVKEYARALMYLEDFLMSKKELVKDHLGFLGRIYAQMHEPEGIKGVLAIQCTQPKLNESVVYHEVTGQYQEALACYELLAKQHHSDACSLRVQLGMVRCCLKLDQPHTALRIAEGVTSNSSENFSAFLEAQAECFWRTNSFSDLEKVLSDPNLENSTAWGVCLGRCLIDVSHNDQEKLAKHLLQTRNSLSKSLSTASLEHGSYHQGYSHVVKLHMLQEVESASVVISKLKSLKENKQSCTEAVQHLVKVWQNRLKLVQAVPGVQEQLLRLHRGLLQLTTTFVQEDHTTLEQTLRNEIGYSWLKSAEFARIAGCYQQAYVYLLHAEKYKPKRHFIELAKLHWEKNVQDNALSTLKRGLEEYFPSSQIPNLEIEDLKICAEAKLLIAIYNDQKVNVDFDVSVTNYKEAIKVYSDSEINNAFLARYFDRMLIDPEDRSVSSANYQLWAVSTYLKSLRYGCSEIYQSMSRILTIWLDYGKRYQQDVIKTSKGNDEYQRNKENLLERKGRLTSMNETLGGYLNVLPPYMFMVGISQLVSRICHPMNDVYGVIKKIIAKLYSTYPQQTMWMMMASFRSSYPIRQSRCQAVLTENIVKEGDGLVRLAHNFRELGDSLVDLCQKQIAQDIKRTTVSALVKKLPRLLANPSFSKIIVPLLSSRTLILPKQDHSSLDTHCPFSLKTPYIVGIVDEVIVLHSLQKPRKIALQGSDGQVYEMMCKDKDDLRLDARVMEFNSIVNNYLRKDPSSRSRNLNIRTYSVVPLSELNGIIEWVPNLIGYRQIIIELMKENGCHVNARDLIKYKPAKDSSLEEKRQNYLRNLLRLHPAVFRHWFRNNFTDSHSWFEARKSYVHTTAVMSMVGYILGLGDRHGENILLDTTCGEIVHVDFNCLFNKGETFEWPEKVPFRLTHNMVSAMGPTGVEGPFRSVCEITLRLLRAERGTLSSVLQPFVYDPLKTKKTSGHDEITNEMAVENVKNIDSRLIGMMKTAQKRCALQLSVEGQTVYLIQEATSIDNLCQMYIGWSAYM